MKRFILTGAPGAGKTSILRQLQEQGFDVVDEAATAIITREQAEGNAEPWTQAAFVVAVVALQRQRQMQSACSDVTLQIYDRSPICTHALSTYLGRPVPETLSAEIDRITRERVYEQQVFFIRNIGFCQPTAARRISFQESLAFERIHEQSYRQFGYELVDVPAGEVVNRVAMIADTISQLT
ncbi:MULTISPECIES: AAA family ATPase [unclassified Streptomyces]|uniref:AAA family ATPase n=1 Tax=unclassified Streptomyces TaxID=2593676 RepID=UPI0004C9EAF5|nr:MULTISPECIES: AAA family ATPase [unclassified Streptomyces]